MLDTAGYRASRSRAAGASTTAVERGVESPWERIRADTQRATRRRSGWRCAARFLVGARPAERRPRAPLRRSARPSRASTSSGCTTRSTTSTTCAVPAEAIREAGGAAVRRPRLRRRRPAATTTWSSTPAACASWAPTAILLHDPAGRARAAPRRRAGRRAARGLRRARRPLLPGPRRHRARRRARGRPRGRRPDRDRRLPRRASLLPRPPPSCSRQALAGVGGRRRARPSTRPGRPRRAIDEHLGDAHERAARVAARRRCCAAPRTACRLGARRRPRAQPARPGADDRLRRGARRARCVVRAESGYPPPASPVGRILAAPGDRHVLSARRWTEVDGRDAQLLLGEWGQRPAPIDPTGAGRRRAPRRRPRRTDEPALEDARAEAGRPRRAPRRSSCLVALFGERRPCRCSSASAAATPERRDRAHALDDGEAERVRRLVRIARGVRRRRADGRGRTACASPCAAATARQRRSQYLAAPPRRRPAAPSCPWLRAGRRVASRARWSATSTARPRPARTAVRRGGRPRRGRPDALPARGDEAVQRVQERTRRRDRARCSWRDGAAGRVRPAAVRARTPL